jgi:hypothetical protein
MERDGGVEAAGQTGGSQILGSSSEENGGDDNNGKSNGDHEQSRTVDSIDLVSTVMLKNQKGSGRDRLKTNSRVSACGGNVRPCQTTLHQRPVTGKGLKKPKNAVDSSSGGGGNGSVVAKHVG